LDYTDLEVMAKIQLENLRQAERQGPLSKRHGDSNVSIASNSSPTSLNITNQHGTKPPVVPKSTIAKNGVKPNNHRRSNTQTISTNVGNHHDLPDATEQKPLPTTNRTTVVQSNSANNNRTRPPVSRPLQAYRGSQTNPKVQTTQKSGKKPTANEFGATFTAKQFSTNENGLLNDVSNKPIRSSQYGRRTQNQSSVEQIPSSSSMDMTSTSGQTSIPRSASSTLNQGRKSGIPTVGKQQRPGIPTATRHHSLSSRRTTINGF